MKVILHTYVSCGTRYTDIHPARSNDNGAYSFDYGHVIAGSYVSTADLDATIKRFGFQVVGHKIQ